MPGELPFEQPLLEVRGKIDELQQISLEKEIDFSDEIRRLEEKYTKLEEDLYRNLTVADRMQIARHPLRPKTLDYINLMFTDFLELHGDRMYGDDLAIVGGIAKFNDLPVTVVGHQKGKDTKDNIARNFGSPYPEGFRKALRLMQQAAKFGRPIITLLDTKGAHAGGEAEERGQSEAIARNLLEMAGFGVPIVCAVIGEGGSGGALALGVGNRVLMLENSFYAVSMPESAAAILYKDSSRSLETAEAMKITASDLHRLGVIDEIIPEPRGGAHKNMEQQAANLKSGLWKHLQELLPMSAEELREDRYRKFRGIGQFTVYQHSVT